MYVCTYPGSLAGPPHSLRTYAPPTAAHICNMYDERTTCHSMLCMYIYTHVRTHCTAGSICTSIHMYKHTYKHIHIHTHHPLQRALGAQPSSLEWPGCMAVWGIDGLGMGHMAATTTDVDAAYAACLLPPTYMIYTQMYMIYTQTYMIYTHICSLLPPPLLSLLLLLLLQNRDGDSNDIVDIQLSHQNT